MNNSTLEVLAWGLSVGFPFALICNNIPFMSAAGLPW